MRMTTIALAAVLLAGPAAAQETRSQSGQPAADEKAKDSESGKAKEEKEKGADAGKGEAGDMKGYGYGTPSGLEAGGSARQSAEAKPSRAPQQESGASVTQSHTRADAATLTGQVVSKGKNRLTIQAPDGMRDIETTDRTEVRGEGRTSVAQVQKGDEVRVSFDPQRGAAIAKRIEVRSTGGKAAAGAELSPAPGSSTPPGSTVTPSGTPSGTTPGTATPGGTTAPGGAAGGEGKR